MLGPSATWGRGWGPSLRMPSLPFRQEAPHATVGIPHLRASPISQFLSPILAEQDTAPHTHTHPVKATEKAQRSLGWTALKKNHTQDHPTNSPYPRSTQPLPDMPTAGKADLRGTHLSPSAECRSRSREQD